MRGSDNIDSASSENIASIDGLFDDVVVAEMFGQKSISDLDPARLSPEAFPLDTTLRRAIETLPGQLRLTLCVYYGLELQLSDLRELVEARGNPNEAARFLADYRARRAKRREQLRSLHDRAGQLTYLIHHSTQRRTRTATWQRWKARIQRILSHRQAVLPMSEVATLMGVSKSTVSRRIDQAMARIRSDSQWKTTGTA